MRLEETLRTSINALNLNKVRSFLTMLGVIIGVFSVITLISIGRGIQNYMTDQFSALGSNLLFVAPGKVNVGQDPGRSFSRNKLEEKHVTLIEMYAGSYLDGITPYVELGDTVSYKNRSFYAGVTGVNHLVPELLNYEIKEGDTFNKADEKSKSKVAILGPSVANELFPNRSPIDNSVEIGGDTFKVIGIFREKGQSFDDMVIIPYTTAMEVFNLDKYSSIVMRVKDSADMDEATKQVKLALLRDLKDDDFTVLSQTNILESIQNILRIFTLGLGAIAAISLVVGGIGIMNIMLVSVTERTREIGLRKALGATSINVALQFLIESILLSVGGGVVGLILGWLASLAARVFVRTEVPWWSVALAFGFSAFVGIVFGTYPAFKASQKDPIEALRYE